MPNGKRVNKQSKIQSIDALNQMEENELLKIANGDMTANYAGFKEAVRNRVIDPVEKLDMAEILHIYYLSSHNISILNEDMGGQTTG